MLPYNNLDTDKKSLKSMRKEFEKLDSQVESASAFRKIMEEERKPIHTVYKWEAPERVFEQKDKKWYLVISSVSVFIVILSLLTGNYLLVVAIVALIVLLYALNNVKPANLIHELTNKGVYINTELYTWKKINYFWISRKGKHFFLNLNFQTKRNEDEQIISFLGQADTKKIVDYMSQFIDYIEETDTNYISRKLFGVIEPLSTFRDN